MVSAWDVYWVLQLDSIVLMLVLFSIFGGIAGLVALLIGGIEGEPVATRFGKRIMGAVVAAAVAAAFIPSSRTAAAMILVPALTSPEVLQPVGAEAKELYELAKGALRKLGDDKPEPTK